MTTTSNSNDLRYSPWEPDVRNDPYPIYRRMREESPLYYNEEHDFYALSRFDDIERAFLDWETYSSSKGVILEIIKANLDFPSGIVIFEDPPLHTVHRRLLSRVFTPKRMQAIEPLVRQYCADCLDPMRGSDGFDLIEVLGAPMPMRVIGMLLGIPEQDQRAIRDRADAALRTEPGQPMERTDAVGGAADIFGDYIDWRAEHPSDDLMTDLLTAEFEDETGTVRRLTREEIVLYTNVVAGAGNETTTNLIGWIAKVLADHPDQRRMIADDRTLVPNTVEEVLRFESPGPQSARYVMRDAEVYGQTVPAGSAMVLVNASANRDERRFPEPDRFDITRETLGHLSLAIGVHYCLGAHLARLEGRVALDELIQRFPEWDVDMDRAHLASTSSVRGFETLPLVLS